MDSFPCNEIKLVATPQLRPDAALPFVFGMPSAGELYVRGTNVFDGYDDDVEQYTSQKLDEYGWFHTGAVCTLAASGAISLIGSKSSFLEIADGVYVNASKLEQLYSQTCDLVHQIWVYGHKSWGAQASATVDGSSDAPRSRPPDLDRAAPLPLVAVVAVDHEVFYEWAQEKRIPVYDIQSICLMEAAKVGASAGVVCTACLLTPHLLFFLLP